MNQPMKPPKHGVKVRMYRQGLGDCFLLAFPSEEQDAVYMLIDCGVLTGTSEAGEKMRDVAKDIRQSTKGRLDIVVITHEHYDHLSGFVLKEAREILDGMDFGAVWVAWTEDPGDELAQRLRQKKKLRLSALEQAHHQLRKVNKASADQLKALLAFSRQTHEGMRRVLEKKDCKLRYLRPGGETVDLANATGARVYVLGPPKNVDQLHKADPSEHDSEVYKARFALDEEIAFMAAVRPKEFGRMLGQDEDETVRRSLPFDPEYRIEKDQAGNDAFFQTHYGFDDGPGERGEAWRRIDNDWLHAAETLALQMDKYTNNTCLALAIELVDSGKVLLFPGDAQVGNMLSWHTHSWRVGDRRMTAEDLLARTVLYKVGHHGSHNATLREKGLELMTSRELVAMIPVDQDTARGRRWNMPFGPLLRRLQTKARGRVIRADDEVPTLKDAPVSEPERAAFKNDTKTGPNKLYHEYTVTD